MEYAEDQILIVLALKAMIALVYVEELLALIV